MNQPNLFEQPSNQETFDENKDYLSELVGEDKKFKDVNSLAKGKALADSYVKTLETKLDEMRADYEEARKANMAGARLEELIDRLNSSSQSNIDTNPNEKDEEKTPSIKSEDIERIVASKIEENKRSEKETANLTTVMTKLRERYGENSAAILEQQRLNLGLEKEDIQALARKSPTAFFRTMGLDQQQQDSFSSPPRSSIRNDNFLPSTQKRTWSYYQGIKKKDRDLYYSPKIIAQMHRDHAELGREFEDGDYNS